MIHRIYSDLPKFKNLEFHPGLNILLSDKSDSSSDKQTRNRAGKSSLLEIIHFILGSYADKDSLCKKDALFKSLFGMDWNIENNRITTERICEKQGFVYINAPYKLNWSHVPTVKKNDYKPSLSSKNWVSVLGELMFKLDEDTQSKSWGPKFRSLFSYFVRRESVGGYISPMKQSIKQQKGDEQVALTFLIGLDWTIPQQLQQTRDREKILREIRRATDKGMLGEILGTAAQLRSDMTVMEDKANQLAAQLSNFQVLPQYREYESEADELTRYISTLNDENTMDTGLLSYLEEAIRTESSPSIPNVEALFHEVGIVLPDTIQRTFEDVRLFHKSVVQNRRLYLEGEIEACRARITKREQEKATLDKRRAEIMSLLKSYGALDHFAALQTEQTRLHSEFERIRQRYESVEYLETQKTELELERNRIYQRLKQDVAEQHEKLRKAILSFESVSSSLYSEAGRLTLQETIDGPEYEVTIQGQSSVGIKKMSIFCFDMMLMQICRGRSIGPDFLIHDSHLFDGVDERQIAHALQEGANLADKYNFQYIITMNSDDLPPDTLFSENFSLDKYILPVRLTDKTEDGGLFGFRFD